jgi:hypothetical protein
MTAIVPTAEALHKDEDWPESIPPAPGGDLLVAFRRARDQGCAVWQLPDSVIVVPRLTWFEATAAPIQRETAIALTRAQPVDLSTRAGDQVRHLTAAAYRDLLAADLETIAELFGYSGERAAREAARKGRELWAQLNAWPWACLPAGALPRQRWGSDALVTAWAVWMTREFPV